MPTCYEVIHDFAGPVATILAAGAARIRHMEPRRPMRLQLDLFEPRFKVYNAAKSLLVDIQRNAIISEEALYSFMTGTTDAAFILDDQVAAYLEEIRLHAIELMQARHAWRDTASYTEDRRA